MINRQAETDILEMLKSKPFVKRINDSWPEQKNIYNVSAIKRYLSEKYSNDDIDAAMNKLKTLKKYNGLLHDINIYNYEYNQYFPYYYYVGETFNIFEMKKFINENKNRLEEESKKLSKETIEKRKEVALNRIQNSKKRK
jgi:hypothetical protein